MMDWNDEWYLIVFDFGYYTVVLRSCFFFYYLDQLVYTWIPMHYFSTRELIERPWELIVFHSQTWTGPSGDNTVSPTHDNFDFCQLLYGKISVQHRVWKINKKVK